MWPLPAHPPPRLRLAPRSSPVAPPRTLPTPGRRTRTGVEALGGRRPARKLQLLYQALLNFPLVRLRDLKVVAFQHRVGRDLRMLDRRRHRDHPRLLVARSP